MKIKELIENGNNYTKKKKILKDSSNAYFLKNLSGIQGNNHEKYFTIFLGFRDRLTTARESSINFFQIPETSIVSVTILKNP